MKRIIIYLTVVLCATLFISCDRFLDREAEGIITYEDVFKDEKMTMSALSNLYGRVNWGPSVDDDMAYIYGDEACWSNGSPQLWKDFGDSHYRVYDYGIIRSINQFLDGLRNSAPDMEISKKRNLEGEVRFLRAWTYFNMCRCMGGMPIIGDNIFSYSSGMDVTDLQYPRSTEAQMYDYIISECEDIARNFLYPDHTKNASRASKWTALALKARAALYAGSIAKWNALNTPEIFTEGGEVGIPADKAAYYYDIAYKAAVEIIKEGNYDLYRKNPDKQVNFYEALTNKNDNPEVIWTLDHYYPGNTTAFSYHNVPTSVAEDEESAHLTPILNFVEAFEYTDNRDGSLKVSDENDEYIFFDKASDPFLNKDSRLWGTVIYPGATFKEQEIVFQAGRISFKDGKWEKEIGVSGSKDSKGNIITSINGPVDNNDNHRNKSGFAIRKFLDTKAQSSTRQGGDMWFVRFRYAEILLIAAEAGLELAGVPESEVAGYVNDLRDRAGLPPLDHVTFEDIVQERRVELAFENHRYWDLKRWRLAHTQWDGRIDNEDAVHYALFPYRVVGGEHDGQWVFEKVKCNMTAYPLYFQMKNYYNFIDQSWRNNNPKLVKNPYQ